MTGGIEVWAWRHPRAREAAGRCIGRTDLAVDRRKAKRLAGRIRAAARRHGLPREIWTSPLRRAANVGRLLRRMGWTHRVDARLCELDFGGWDGRPWSAIPRAEVAAWEADFLRHAPGGGESQATLRARISSFIQEHQDSTSTAVLLVSHAGWIASLERSAPCEDASRWPRPLAHMAFRKVFVERLGLAKA